MLNHRTMRKYCAILLGVVAVFSWSRAASAAPDTDTADNGVSPNVDEVYMRARVTDIVDESENVFDGVSYVVQHVDVVITSGDEKDTTHRIGYGDHDFVTQREKMHVDDDVVVVKVFTPDGEEYYITEHYRNTTLFWIMGIFALLVVIIAGKRGLMSFAGLVASIAILVYVIARPILHGGDPLFWSVAGAVLITVVTLYISHGWHVRTHVSVASMLLSLGLAVLLSAVVVAAAKLSGNGSEEAFLLQNGAYGTIDLRGLLLAGMLIGTLGVLDDVTTAQAASIEQIHKADPTLPWQELYKRGLAIGREHIASLINTLVLAYAGASLALFVLFMANPKPWWVVFNSAMIAEEVVRTIVGSAALILSVPLATFFAAKVFYRMHHDH